MAAGRGWGIGRLGIGLNLLLSAMPVFFCSSYLSPLQFPKVVGALPNALFQVNSTLVLVVGPCGGLVMRHVPHSCPRYAVARRLLHVAVERRNMKWKRDDFILSLMDLYHLRAARHPRDAKTDQRQGAAMPLLLRSDIDGSHASDQRYSKNASLWSRHASSESHL